MKRKTVISSPFFCIIFGLILVFLDQITKIIAVNNLKDSDPYVLIPGVFEFRYLENHGAAFGIMQNARLFFILITAVISIFIIYMLIRMPSDAHYDLLRLILTAVLAGALGNFIDRLVLIYVRDFLYFSLINFPVFNVADCYVTVGTFLLCLCILFFYKEDDFYFLTGRKHE